MPSIWDMRTSAGPLERIVGIMIPCLGVLYTKGGISMGTQNKHFWKACQYLGGMPRSMQVEVVMSLGLRVQGLGVQGLGA